MQQPMHSYVCGIKLRSESSLEMSELFSRKTGVPEFDRNVFIAQKVNTMYGLVRIISELVRRNHRLLHDIPRFSIFFIEKLFFIFNQMLTICVGME